MKTNALHSILVPSPPSAGERARVRGAFSCTRPPHPNPHPHRNGGEGTRKKAACGWLIIPLLLLVLPGCSLGVMGGKMLTGDPTVPAAFKSMTGTDLTKGKHRVVVVCTVPAAVNEELSSLNIELIEGITRRMKLEGIDVVKADQVGRWIDDNGGVVSDPNAMAREFDVDYVAWIDLQAFSLREDVARENDNSHLLRGRVQGFIRAYKVEEVSGDRVALNAFNKEFTTTYPPHQPVSEVGRSALLFQKEFIDRVCDQLAETFYDHRPGTDI
jgi:hypothetical protein